MISTICLNSSSKQFTKDFPTADISDYCLRDQNIVWVDVSDPSGQDFLDLAEEFNFHPLSIEDVRHAHQRPKIEEYKGYYFIVLYEAQLAGPTDRLELRELSIFLGTNYVVTVHSKPIRAIETVRKLWGEWADRSEQGAGMLAYLLFDVIVDDYLPLLDILSERVDNLSDEIFTDFKPESLQSIFRIKKQLLHLRRSIAPLRDVFNVMLRREQPIFAREIYVYFQDVFDHLIRVADSIDTLREMLGTAMDAYLSVSSNRTNLVMKRLTSVSTILMSVTLIAGIYGMNFEIMPELKWRYGYIFALGSMVAVGLIIYLYLKKSKWI